MLTGLPLLLLILLAIIFIVFASTVWKVHPFLSILLASLGLGIGTGLSFTTIISAINGGFGGLMGYIGLIVVLGSIIGVILEKSGAALRIADTLLALIGKKRPALAMSLIGATVSIPVFCDSGFIILSGLNKALARKTAAKEATLALTLAAGLYTTHTLIPPTPGPIAAAGNLGASDFLGVIMLMGLVVSIPTLIASYFFAQKVGANLQLKDNTLTIEENIKLPSVSLSLAPILIPILLIAAATIVKFIAWEGQIVAIIRFIGDPLIALLIGLIFALFLLPKWDKTHLNDWLAEGIKLAGPILIITGAGGAFGGVLKATALKSMVESWASSGQVAGLGFLIFAFGLAALLKTAQGSSTNALVITSSVLAPLTTTMGFTSPYELSLIVMAIGGGAMTVSHANDSYFWVVSQFSGINMKSAYRSFTLMTGLQGLTVLIMTLFLYAFS